MVDFYIKQNDTGPPFQRTLTDSDDNPINLTSGNVDFHMREKEGSSAVIDTSASILDASGGDVEYDWDSKDTSAAGIFRGEFEATLSGGTVRTFPRDGNYTISITEEIA